MTDEEQLHENIKSLKIVDSFRGLSLQELGK